jgi:glycosyltransferase involved in cell wall biosynthesis
MKISLIIPCYNEQSNIQKGVLDKIGNFTESDDRFIEVIIVDDGSTDSSKQVIKSRYLKNYPKFKLVENSHQGKAFAIITGVEKSKGDYVLFSDIDLATPIEESERLIDSAMKGYEIVIGSRSKTREGAPLLRKVLAYLSIIVRSFIIGIKGIKDTQCGFKLFKKAVGDRVIANLLVFHERRQVEGSSVSAAFDMEFLFLASKMGYRIKEIPVQWRHVETKNVTFIKDAVETMADILTIKYYYLTGRYEINKK